MRVVWRPDARSLTTLASQVLAVAIYAVLIHAYNVKASHHPRIGPPDGLELAAATGVVIVGGLFGGLFHLTGHALAVRRLGHRVTLIGTGSWPMATFTMGRTKLELGLTPGHERYRYAIQRPPLTARQHRLILVSGPAATLILVAAGVAAAESAAPRLLRLTCLAFAISQFGQLVESLTPRASAPFADGSQLGHLRRYKAAFGLHSKGRIAYNRLDFVRAENLYRRALAERRTRCCAGLSPWNWLQRLHTCAGSTSRRSSPVTLRHP